MQNYLLLLILFTLLPSHLQGHQPLPVTLYSQSSGNWNTPAIWNTQRNGSGAPYTNPNNTIGPTGPVYHIVIQSGHTIILNDTKGITSIYVETGGKIYRNTTSNRYLEIYGASVVVDGIMGNGGIYDGIGIELQSPYCAISGNGSIHLSRLRKQAFVDTNADILTDLTLNYSGAALYNDIEGYAFNVNIPAGVKVMLTNGDVSIDGVDGTNNSHRWGTFSINGTLEIGRNLYVTTDNPIAGSQDIAYLIGAGGQIIVHGQVIGNAMVSGNANAQLFLAGNAKLTVNGPGEVFLNIDGNRDNFLLQSSSEVHYAGGSTQFIEDELLYAGISINGGSEKILEGNVLVNETLWLNSGYPVLETHNLIINGGGTIVGGSDAAYVKTTATGKLIQNIGPLTITFPIGVNSFTPISLSNSGAADIFAIRVMEQVLENGLSGQAHTSGFVNNTWVVEELSPGGSNLNMDVQWQHFNELPLFDRNACYISQYIGEWDAPAPTAASGNGPFQQIRNNLSTVGLFTVGSGGQVPVELSYFTATSQDGMNLLEWETASESDNKEFVVERKSINAAFTELARIAGAGTSEGPNLYSFTDTNPEYGFNYYRLKQIDFDGQFVYSPIRVVYLDKEVREIFIWPNPVSDVFTVYFDKGGELSILNAQGQMCYSRIFDKEFSHSVDISSFPTGLYILGLKTTDGIFSKKLFRK